MDFGQKFLSIRSYIDEKKIWRQKNFIPPPTFCHALKIFLAQNNHMTYQIGREFNADIEYDIIFQIKLKVFKLFTIKL